MNDSELPLVQIGLTIRPHHRVARLDVVLGCGRIVLGDAGEQVQLLLVVGGWACLAARTEGHTMIPKVRSVAYARSNRKALCKLTSNPRIAEFQLVGFCESK